MPTSSHAFEVDTVFCLFKDIKCKIYGKVDNKSNVIEFNDFGRTAPRYIKNPYQHLHVFDDVNQFQLEFTMVVYEK